RQPFQDAQYFPSEAYVATSDHGTSTNKNVIRMKSRRFIFLDTGYWMSYARNFSVIWGRHVYLCRYTRERSDASFKGKADRLDQQFFAGLNGHVQVISCASAVWAPEDEFDWNKLVVVLPDMHLMTGPHGSPWHSRFVLDPELDLLDFAKRICDIDELEGKLQIIHIGDSYD